MWYTNLPEMFSLEGSPLTTLEAHEALNTTLAKFLSITRLLQHSVHMRQWAYKTTCVPFHPILLSSLGALRHDLHDRY
jgi:hypothetical protein